MKERGTRQRGAGAGTFFLQVALCLLVASCAYGDFYRYTGEDGVEVYTNTPVKGGVKVMRESSGKSEQKREGARRPEVKREAKEAATCEPLSSSQDPLLPVKGVVTSKVGWRHDPIDGAIRHHNGVDIAVAVGTSVRAIAAGRVLESAPHGGYGNLVAIEHPDGSTSLYGHNSQLNVRAGDQVAAGDTIALSGSTGRSTGPHLHFELWRNGSNVTEAYLKTGAGLPDVSGGVRSYLHKDGSIVFTNLR
ncbi:M23 family metallopeptidase [Geomonas sp.]|uniref:M23 family metallopeptidase n=1 Tax=Geomonas sp. TaxID=2651584 RepID=UPI002B49E094|nr:M23 family metallopeptidase [Geomonas sp.]HJV36234.1 M23 family metallopeptidase [Geomonas sp.]